jgi:2-polyprenyl-3-methyl-5-hydroxy-6-metoxy-1,4-benzoquinol methylase
VTDDPLETKQREMRRYWDAHPISVDSVPYAPGTRESFDAIYQGWERDASGRQFDLLRMCEGQRVLEIGCGVGKIARFLAKNGVAYHAVDASRRSLHLAH